MTKGTNTKVNNKDIYPAARNRLFFVNPKNINFLNFIPKIGQITIDASSQFLHTLLTKKITIAKWQFNLFGLICIGIGFTFGAYSTINTIIPIIFASDLSQEWDFTVSGDYVLSDQNLITVANESARLSVQNYTTDANTAALFHFDETEGGTAADSSGNDNDGAVTGATFGAGQLNNALTFDGNSDFVAVPDSASLSLSQSNTLEAWTKFSNTFSAGSHDNNQGIMDKGDYRLFYNYNTGKLQYELADASSTTWTQQAGNDIKGSWDLNGKITIESQTVANNILYVGLGNAIADAEVWAWNGSTWTQIGGDELNSSWQDQTYEAVYSLTTDGTNVYAGLGLTAGDAEVWSWNGSSWTKIGGDALNQSWQVNTFEGVYSMTYFNSTLYAGLGLSANDAEVWSWNGSTWTKIGGDNLNSGWNTGFEYVYQMVNDGTNLYVGLGSTAGDAEVWSWNGSSWTKIGGDGTGWADTTFEFVLSMLYQGSTLYVGLGSTAGDADLWAYTSGNWSQIGGDGLDSSWAASTYEGVYSLRSDGTNIYAGLGTTAGDNEVWQWDGDTWNKIGGDAVNSGFTNTHTIVSTLSWYNDTLYAGLTGTVSSELWVFSGGVWTQVGGNYYNNSWGFYNLQSVESMTTYSDKLYAGTGVSVAGNAMVWEFDGNSWDLIGGQGLNGSWAGKTYETISSMISDGGNLYVGMGVTANDAEVWQWDGETWTKIGGDSINQGWLTNYEQVTSMAVFQGNLHVGLGNSASDAEVWRWNSGTTTWTKIGGDNSNFGWNTGYERVISMAVYNNLLYAGLGITAGDSEVWAWNGSAWTKVAGDSVNSGWDNTIEEVDYLAVYNGKLYAGLGTTTDDAEMWEYNGSTWAKIGGDDVNSSWAAGTYEQVKSITVYNGKLIVGLGNTAGDSEVWEYNGSIWTKIGGNSLNSSWGNAVESVNSFSVYFGKLYAGTGNTGNADATIYSYGNNGILQSTTTGQDTNWHHIAATYDGATMKLYIDGQLDSQTSKSLSLPDTTNSLYIGTIGSGRESGIAQGYFEGSIDEVRISNSTRTEFNSTPYTANAQSVRPQSSYGTSGILSWDGFTSDETTGGGTINYRLSNDGGSTWKYYNSSWITSSSLAQANSASVINNNIATFPVGSGGILWQAVLDGNGNQQVTLNSVTLTATADNTAPTAPDSLTALNQSGGSAITTDTWYKHTSPYFSWSGATDTGGSGVAGYFVYFGTDNTADPQTAGNFQAETTYTASSLSSGTTYYLRIKSKDNAGNISSIYPAFIYKFDNTAPSNPSLVSVNPAGFATTNDFTFSWAAAGTEGGASDAHSGLSGGAFGYEYRTGASSGNCSSPSGWTSTTTNSVNIPEAAYVEGSSANIFYLRTTDAASNTAGVCVTVNYYFAGEGPSAPQLLTATPSTNTTNSFAFSWQPPQSYSGDSSDLTYCYTVNTLPSESSCTYTSPGATSLSADSFATQQGLNTFYLAAKNPEDLGGIINYGVYTSSTFTANTSAPGIPGNIDIADVSVKSSSSWKLAVSWESPSDTGSGIEGYEIFHSTDDITYIKVASTSGIAYVDTGLTQTTHYYKVRACDSVNNCGAYTSAVDLIPTGKYTEAPSLSSGPVSTAITTKKATISWSTDRTADSKVSYGTSSGSYFSEEPSNSTQVTDHTINITNLSPGTTYYYKAKWTDEDGNTGFSAEKTFSTEPSPTVTDPKIKSSSLTSVILEFTVTGASKAKVYYGKTSAFGGVKEISTSTAQTTYNLELPDLEDGTKYFYKINTLDTESAEYEGSILSFETLPRPKIANVRVQQVAGTAQSTLLVTWDTNTETSSIVTYYPESQPSAANDEINIALISGEHKMIVKNLLPQTSYTLLVKGRDKAGNEAVSEPQRVTTATDTRAPQITDLKIEGSTASGNNNQEATAQLVVSWNSDETSTTQVEFGEGTGTTYSQKTQEDTSTTTNHLVVISGLTPSKVYHLRAISRDTASNIGYSIDTVTITPKATDNALNLVISNLSQIFGFLGGLAN